MIPDAAYRRLADVARAHLSALAASAAADADRIGCYRIGTRIGKGSYAEVFRATDPDGLPVAVKLLHRRWRPDRYAREVELLERTSSVEGIVGLLDAGRSPRGPYLVLELAEGGSLRSLLRERGRLPWEEALRLIGQVAETLGVLHAKGIIHRDLKPENILIRGDGRPLISDLGLAKDLGAVDGELTQAGFALGTIGYMSPELLDGQRERLGAWTDVFSLGAVLHELIAGRPPFSGSTVVEAARAIQKEAVRALRGVPASVNGIIRRCLQKEHDQRFASGGELAVAIQAALAGEG